MPRQGAFAQQSGDPSQPPATNDAGVAVPNPGLNPSTPAPLVPWARVAQAAAPTGPAAAPTCKDPNKDPYKDYACLDDYLGEGFWERFINYYRLEDGHATAPSDPNAPSPHRDGWPRTPATVPPMAYTEWPTGAMDNIGVTRPAGADSPLMVAIANTGLGQWLGDHNTQIYGWLEPGANFSTSSNYPGGNGPIGYTTNPNEVQLDQAVLYFDRWPDTVQTDHLDWGYRLSALWGQNYRFTNSYGLLSWQYNGANNQYGWDFPMEWVEFYVPRIFDIPIFEGEEIRIGRYISIPDIEAQLAPNNLTYTHSLTYTWDNYTNTGIVFSTQVTKNILVQMGLTDGTETPLWHLNAHEQNMFLTNPNLVATSSLPFPAGLTAGTDPLYPGKDFRKDPGAQPSATFCVRFVWNDGWDTLYPCLDGINNGTWGYNNLQWHGFTFYHRFNQYWHTDFEAYYLDEHHVPNARNAQAVYLYENGGTPFSPQYLPYNGPNVVYCKNATSLDCTPSAIGVLDYLNYTPNPDNPLDNFTLRTEYYYDPYGWRTGTAAAFLGTSPTGNGTTTAGFTRYAEVTIGWQHWLSPQIEFRPEISYWYSFSTPAFNGNPNAAIPPNHHTLVELASDAIIHF